MRHDYYGYDQDYEVDAPTGRCEGTNHHKCGRFCGNSFHCARCIAEMSAEAREELLIEAAEDAARRAIEDARWVGREVYTDAEAAWATDEDLPF